jgi:hypothetical protein
MNLSLGGKNTFILQKAHKDFFLYVGEVASMLEGDFFNSFIQ